MSETWHFKSYILTGLIWNWHVFPETAVKRVTFNMQKQKKIHYFINLRVKPRFLEKKTLKVEIRDSKKLYYTDLENWKYEYFKNTPFWVKNGSHATVSTSIAWHCYLRASWTFWVKKEILMENLTPRDKLVIWGGK